MYSNPDFGYVDTGSFYFLIQIQNAENNYWVGPILINHTEYTEQLNF